MQGKFEALVRFFKVLADESRLKILGILANRQCSVGELAVLLELTEPTVSHHLAKLRELGLVEMRQEGTTHLYRMNAEALRAMSKEVFTPETMALLADNVAYDTWERKVLGSFLEDGRLIKIPANRKKRQVVLRWLAAQFEAGVAYPESAVNEIIQRYHPDSATLRRELVADMLMRRENGVYWRLSDSPDNL